MEGLVLHELAHGLLSLGETGSLGTETVCNRIAKLVLGDDVRLPNDWKSARDWNVPDLFDAMAVDLALAPIVRILIDELEDADRDILNRYYYEQQTYGEIADALGLKYRETAKRRVAIAHQRLKRLLEAGGWA
jgi:DNA-directed RNA polymerase specialized sigma24 family protein